MLPRPITPITGESLNSYLPRLAQANHLTLAEVLAALPSWFSTKINNPDELSQHHMLVPATTEARGDVLVVQDERMLSDWDEHGYETPDSTVGPFTLSDQPCSAPQFPALVQRDPYARDPAYQFEPYPVTVVGAGLWLVTIITQTTRARSPAASSTP